MKELTEVRKFHLGFSDVSSLSSLRDTYKASLGFAVSSSIVISVALQSLAEEVSRGVVRKHPAMRLSR
ncbi:hypothetical protein [Azospirillum sp. sgz301742]